MDCEREVQSLPTTQKKQNHAARPSNETSATQSSLPFDDRGMLLLLRTEIIAVGYRSLLCCCVRARSWAGDLGKDGILEAGSREQLQDSAYEIRPELNRFALHHALSKYLDTQKSFLICTD